MINFIRTKPIFLFLLPLFFVLHGFTDYYDFIPVMDALFLVLIYMGSSLLIAAMFWLFYRNFTKASLPAFLIMCFHFFFGSIQDLLTDNFHDAFITRYSFILPVSFIFFLAVIIMIKKRKKTFLKLIAYLNILLLLLIAGDIVWLTGKITSQKDNPAFTQASENFTWCDSCKKPDIYFIALDEYAGNTELKELLNFDNSPFENELRQRGFHVTEETSSNYNNTRYSIASTLNMDYLELNMKTKESGNFKYCNRVTRNNQVLKFLTVYGYQFYNYSVFDFTGQPSLNYDNFLPSKTKLITSQTFLSRLLRDILSSITSGKFSFRPLLKKYMYKHLHNNENIFQLTHEIASRQTSSPKFVYTHFMMPHYPYYFDSIGNELPFKRLVEAGPYNQNDYTSYLQYCNKKILQLVDDLRATSQTPPVIMLIGDHGFRHFKKEVEDKYYFLNLNAVYLPDKNYSQFYDSMSNVNLFRILFNTQFQQHLPILKDSTIYLWKQQ